MSDWVLTKLNIVFSFLENATFIRDDTVQGGQYLGNAPVIDGRGITIAREAHEIVKEYEAEKTTRAAGKLALLPIILIYVLPMNHFSSHSVA